MRFELNISGIRTPFELSEDGKITIVKKKTGWERVEKGDAYLSYVYPFTVIEGETESDDNYFKDARYFNDEKVRDNIFKAFGIWRKLLQWQALNDKLVTDIENCYTFFIDKEGISILHNPHHIVPILSVTFSSYTKAKECLELFRDDLNWLVKDFYFRLDAAK